MRIAGCDLGKAAAKFVVGTWTNGRLDVEAVDVVAHEGRPMEAFGVWYRDKAIHTCAALAATGVHASELGGPIVGPLPEDGCVEAALSAAGIPAGPVNVVSVGARGYAVLVRDADGRTRYVENDKCSSGTGETMVKIAGRFGLSIEAADALALDASESIPITARCSVFAKSEMTHFGNQGRPAAALFAGYFRSVAGYVAALLARTRVDGPVVAVGGCTRIASLIAGLSASTGVPVRVPEGALYIEALGAALLAGEQATAAVLPPLPGSPDALICRREQRFETLPASVGWADRVTRLPAPVVSVGAEPEPCVLGLDLGSTGSKAVLTSIETGDPVLSIYDRTRGNPVDAARRLIQTLLARTTPDIRAVGVTGSGREAVATVLRAAWPDESDRIVVLTEIVAHGTAAIRADPQGGESLSVVEIGGQDAKFIQIVGGQIVESDMNKACSAGTGSFLEEQGLFYGITDIEVFTDLAQQAKRPPDLGQMCTVFVAEAAAQAHNGGYSVPDLFGGFQYSVVHNYINRVMGQRTFGRRIFFQGKPATGPSLAWTLAAVTDRDVIVPHDPGAMGAWGIGLCAVDALGRARLLTEGGLPAAAVPAAKVVSRREFQCRDKRCDTLCTIDRVRVEVGETVQTVVSGGACPKYEIARAGSQKLPLEAPRAFDERRALLAPYLEDRPGERVVGVPAVGACIGALPWLVTFLDGLGLGVTVLQGDGRSLARGEERCYAYDACAPVKVAHGVLDADVGTIFFPKLLTLGDPDGAGGRTCPMEQALPETIREALRARGGTTEIISPALSLAMNGAPDVLDRVRQLAEAARRLGVDGELALAAAQRADVAQRRFDEELATVGRRTLSYGRTHEVPVVLVAGSLHIIHEDGINGSIPRLLVENGVLALPMDCLPVPGTVPPLAGVPWADANRALRAAVTARGRGDVYPLLLTSFGCGPSSFSEQIFTDLLAGYPHTVLEVDGHGGTAGYVTRVQAFLHAVRSHDRAPSAPAYSALARLEGEHIEPITEVNGAQVVVLSVAQHYSDHIASVYRSFGVDAISAGPTTGESLALGRQDCSGKECLPYQLIWGGFRRHIDAAPADRQTVLLQATGEGACRNCMFTTKDRINLERRGLQDRVTPRPLGAEAELGWSFMGRIWTATLAWDILFQLAAYHRAAERVPGEVDLLVDQFNEELRTLLRRPAGDGLTRSLTTTRLMGQARAMVERASRAFAAVGQRPRADLRTVLVAGDIFLRVDDFASDQLIRRLNQRGLRVIGEGFVSLSEYLTELRSPEILGLPTDRVDNIMRKAFMGNMRQDWYARVRQVHPWLPNNDTRAMIREAETMLDKHPVGEAPATVGSVLHHYKSGHCDGAVVVSPWGCGPALIAEALLKHRREIPMLFVYGDGTPLDERKLDAFAFRLRRTKREAADPPRGVLSG